MGCLRAEFYRCARTMAIGSSVIPDQAAWSAVLKRDRRYDGKFVYAAVTTGIYCRPSCPARNPQRRHTLIFQTFDEAERQGYVACRRCHPSSLAPAEKGIKAALNYIQRNLDQPITLNRLSLVSGLSAHHLQETFKRIVGLSPKAFCDAQRIFRFKRLIRMGQSVSRACYDVGYGSSRALYEKTRKGLGMSPAVFARGAKGLPVSYAMIQTARGPVLVAGTPDGVCAVLLAKNERLLLRQLHEELPHATFSEHSCEMWSATVLACQSEDPLLSNLPIRLQTRIFQARVWKACVAKRNLCRFYRSKPDLSR